MKMTARTSRHWALAGMFLVLLAILGGRPETSRAQTVGERLDKAVGQIREQGRELAADLRAGFERAREAVNGMSVEARVYARLHWDKALSDADITVDLQDGGVVVLTGTVASEEAKAKATTLAEDTVGIQRAVNRLAVRDSSG